MGRNSEHYTTTRMNVLRIERKQNVVTVGALYQKLKEEAPRCAIQVPSNLDDYRLGGKGDLLQFLMSWAECCPNAPVVTHVSPGASTASATAQLRKLFSEEHGFLLGLITRQFGLLPQRRFLDAGLEEIPATVVESAFNDCRICETAEPLIKGSRAFVAIDDLIDQSNKILSAYTNVYRRRNPHHSPLKESFAKLLNELFNRTSRAIGQNSSAGILPLRKFVDHVTQFTYELFENADRWGARPYDKNVRGILLHLHFRESRGGTPFHQQVGKENPLSDYLLNFVQEDGYERTPFLELSVFDNGPTLATHFLSREPKGLREEYKATVDCLLFASGRSSKPTEGRGLYETMKLLNTSRGFLRYRGNRLALYRDFVSTPLDIQKLDAAESDNRDKRQKAMRDTLFLNDWVSRTCKTRTHTKAVGSFFTIIVPVEEITA